MKIYSLTQIPSILMLNQIPVKLMLKIVTRSVEHNLSFIKVSQSNGKLAYI